jgi:hypothetical protein
MPTTQTYTYGAVKTAEYVNPCTGQLVQEFGTAMTEMLTVSKLDREYRPFPEDLVAAMTPRSTQYKTVSSYKDEQVITAGQVACNIGGVWSFPMKYTERHYFRCGTPGSVLNIPIPHWETYLRNKIHGDLVNFADTIGEWREAVTMTEDFARLAKKSVRMARMMLRSSHKRKAWKLYFKDVVGYDPQDRYDLLDLMSADMMLKFGVVPQISLLHDTVEKLNYVSLMGVRRAYSFSRTAEDSKEIDGKLAGGYGGTLRTEEKVNVRGKAWVVLDPSRGSFTAGNLASAIWAGTRLSFMLDWFLDVGAYLEAITALEGVRSMKMYVTTRRTTKWIDKVKTRPEVTGYTCPRPGRTTKVSHYRQVYDTVPFPRAVETRSSATWGKLLSSVEIFTQLRRTVGRPGKGLPLWSFSSRF